MNAIQEIKETYTLEDFKEIANHGCQSGVCSQHIYYGDTIEFFTKYPDEITSFIKDNLGIEAIEAVIGDSDGDYNQWMNDMTWMFIELVAMQVVDDYEDAVSDLGDGYNPSRSMTESRYAQV